MIIQLDEQDLKHAVRGWLKEQRVEGVVDKVEIDTSNGTVRVTVGEKAKRIRKRKATPIVGTAS